MGYTRSRRYANHKGGKKYDGPVPEGKKGQSGAHGRDELPHTEEDPQKAKSARIFYARWQEAHNNAEYQALREAFKTRYENPTTQDDSVTESCEKTLLSRRTALTGLAGLTLTGVAAMLMPPRVAKSIALDELPNTELPSSPAHEELHPATNTGAVVDAVEAFLKTLTEAQRRTVLIDSSPENDGRWSNFPAGVVPRNGIFFRDLSAEQLAAALSVARLILSGLGFARLQKIRAADDVYAKSSASRPPGGGPGGRPGGPGGPPPGGGFGGSGSPGGSPRTGGPGENLFGQGNYAIALLGQPSKTKPWMLQFGGHHLAVNHYYNGPVASATPYFVGIEPIRWTDADGKTHDPLKEMRDAMQGILQSLTPEQRDAARLAGRFEDVSVGPGHDGQFPAMREGVAYPRLSPSAQTFVKQAILAWTSDAPQAADYQRRYLSELEQTSIAYSGTGELKAVGDYVRINGPHVWIELACQPSRTEFPIHFHTVWRDRATDYGTAVRPAPWTNGRAR